MKISIYVGENEETLEDGQELLRCMCARACAHRVYTASIKYGFEF